MAEANYVPGGWFGLVRSGTAVILGPESPPALIRTVWELLQEGPEVHEVLHAVTGGLGIPLSSCPPFGIIGFRESLRVFLRGDLDLSVALPAGPLKLDGRNVTTWTERWLDSPEWFSLSVPDEPGRSGGSGALELPVAEGVVLLQALRVDVADTGTTAVTATFAVTGSSTEASAETMVGLEETGLQDALLEAAPLGDPPLEDEGNPADAPAAATEVTSSYDHLWEKTVMRSIEDAAVRTGEDDDGGPQAVGAGVETESPAAGFARGAEPAAAAPAAAPVVGPPAPGGLIDSVPWATAGDSAPRPSAPPSFISMPDHRATAVETPQPEQIQPEQILPAQSQPVPAPAGAPAPPYPAEGDHDGQTVFKSELGAVPAQAPAASAATPGDGPLVLARVCGAGHASPPTSGQCSSCGSPLPDVAVQAPRPRLGRVRLSTGEVIELQESLVIGRQPSVSRVQGGSMPRLIQVASPGGDISRSHVEVRLEGWHVMLCDLKATNGTVLVREGQPPRRLAQNEMAIVLDGDIAELGDDVSLRFEEIL
jgi:hypothetical protein